MAENRTLSRWHDGPSLPAFCGGAADLDAAVERALRGTSSLLERPALEGLPEELAPWRVAFMPFALGGAVTVLVESLAEQSDVQRAFEASELRFRMLVNAAVDGIAMHRAGVVLYVNPAAVRMLGYRSAEELIGRPVQEFVHPADRSAVQQRMTLAEAGREVALRAEKFLRKDGSSVDVEAQVSRVPVDNGYASFVFFRDVTDRNRMTQELERASRLESLGRMAGSVAHDFNNLISTMMRSLELARAEIGGAGARGAGAGRRGRGGAPRPRRDPAAVDLQPWLGCRGNGRGCQRDRRGSGFSGFPRRGSRGAFRSGAGAAGRARLDRFLPAPSSRAELAPERSGRRTRRRHGRRDDVAAR